MKPKTKIPDKHLEIFAEIIIRAMSDDKLALVRAVHKSTGKEHTLLCLTDTTLTGVGFAPVAVIHGSTILADLFYNPEDPTEDHNPNLN